MNKFSVLLSVYAKESPEYLEQSLNSLAIQSLPANEVVLVVDGIIPEGLEKVIDKWRSFLPMVTIYLPENVGLGNALNIGLQNTTFNLIARMDSDDICIPDRFEKQIKYFELYPETSLLGGAIIEFESNTRIKERVRFSSAEHKDIVEYSVSRNPFNHMTMMFRKDIVIQVGSYQHHHFMEDYNLWLRCIAHKTTCHNLDDVLVKARVGNKMLARRGGIAYVKSEIKLARLKFKVFPDRKMKIISVSVLRIFTRLLPIKALSLIYKITRG